MGVKTVADFWLLVLLIAVLSLPLLAFVLYRFLPLAQERDATKLFLDKLHGAPASRRRYATTFRATQEAMLACGTDGKVRVDVYGWESLNALVHVDDHGPVFSVSWPYSRLPLAEQRAGIVMLLARKGVDKAANVLPFLLRDVVLQPTDPMSVQEVWLQSAKEADVLALGLLKEPRPMLRLLHALSTSDNSVPPGVADPQLAYSFLAWPVPDPGPFGTPWPDVERDRLIALTDIAGAEAIDEDRPPSGPPPVAEAPPTPWKAPRPPARLVWWHSEAEPFPWWSGVAAGLSLLAIGAVFCLGLTALGLALGRAGDLAPLLGIFVILIAWGLGLLTTVLAAFFAGLVGSAEGRYHLGFVSVLLYTSVAVPVGAAVALVPGVLAESPSSLPARLVFGLLAGLAASSIVFGLFGVLMAWIVTRLARPKREEVLAPSKAA